MSCIDELGRLAAGRATQPDLPAIMAGGRRRRRRTRLAWTAAGLATAAIVAPAAFVVTSGTTTPPMPGVAAAPGPASSVEPVDGHGLEMTAAVTEALPTAELANQSVTNNRGTSGFYTRETTTADGEWEAGWSQTYAADGIQQVLLTTATTTDSEFGEARPWNPCSDDSHDCTATQVGDRVVTVNDSFRARRRQVDPQRPGDACRRCRWRPGGRERLRGRRRRVRGPRRSCRRSRP